MLVYNIFPLKIMYEIFIWMEKNEEKYRWWYSYFYLVKKVMRKKKVSFKNKNSNFVFLFFSIWNLTLSDFFFYIFLTRLFVVRSMSNLFLVFPNSFSNDRVRYPKRDSNAKVNVYLGSIWWTKCNLPIHTSLTGL